MCFEVREAVEADIPDIYKYIHERYMQKYSNLAEDEAFIQHYAWYKEAFKSNDHKIYIIYNKKDKFIGQIRYEISTENARIGIYLIEEVRGKGVAEGALEKSIKLLTNENKRLENIIANIMDENEKSIRLFKKCGFKYSETNIDMLKFIRKVV